MVMDMLIPMGTKPKRLAIAITVLLSHSAYAGDWTLAPAVEANYHWVAIRSDGDILADDGGDYTDQVRQVTANLESQYVSSKVFLRANIEADSVHHKVDEPEWSEVSYDASGRIEIIDNSLFLSASGSRDFRVINSKYGIFADNIVGTDALSAVDSKQASLQYNKVSDRDIRLQAVAQIMQTSADESELSAQDADFSSVYDTQSTQISFNASEGSNSRVEWNLALSTSDSDRSEVSDYQQSQFAADVLVPLSRRWSWSSQASILKYQVGDDDSLSDGLSYQQFGTGFNYKFGEMSNIDVLAYRSKTGDLDYRSFVGGTLEVYFSPRTDMTLSYDRNQFGENYDFSLNHASRFWRTRAFYSEGVTLSTLEQFNNQTVGLVCPSAEFNVSSCYIPVDPAYQLADDEQLFSITSQSFELEDQITYQERAGLALYLNNQRRLTATFSAAYSEQEVLEGVLLGQRQESEDYNASIGYQLSSVTSAELSAGLVSLRYPDELTEAGETRVDDNIVSALSIRSERSPHLTLEASVSRRERRSNSADADYSDDRIRVGLEYTF